MVRLRLQGDQMNKNAFAKGMIQDEDGQLKHYENIPSDGAAFALLATWARVEMLPTKLRTPSPPAHTRITEMVHTANLVEQALDHIDEDKIKGELDMFLDEIPSEMFEASRIFRIASDTLLVLSIAESVANYLPNSDDLEVLAFYISTILTDEGYKFSAAHELIQVEFLMCAVDLEHRAPMFIEYYHLLAGILQQIGTSNAWLGLQRDDIDDLIEDEERHETVLYTLEELEEWNDEEMDI